MKPLSLSCLVASLCWAGAPKSGIPHLDQFQEAWGRIQSSPTKAAQEFAALAISEPGIFDLAAWGRIQAYARTDASAELSLIDSLAGVESTPVALLARERLAELRYPEGAKADSVEIPALKSMLDHRLYPSCRARLRRRLLADLVVARKFSEAEPLALDLLATDTSLGQVRRISSGFVHDTTFLRSPELRLSLARALFASNPDSSLSILDSLKRGRTPAPAEWILRGRVQMELGDADAAIAAFRHGAEDPREEQPLLWLAKGLERVGRPDDARTAFAEYAHRWPKAPKAQEWLWTNGMDAERAGKCDEAANWYERVKAGGGRRGDWARFREGYCWFRAGEYARAEKVFAREKAILQSGSQRDAAWFFMAQSMRLGGNESKAKSEFIALSQAAPWGFHGHIARRAAGTDSAFSDSLRKVRDTGAILWPGERPIHLERADTLGLLRLLCARELGEDRLTSEIARHLDESFASHGEREFALVRWLRSLGMEQDAGPRLRKLLGKLPMEEIAKLPRSVMREFYPMPYIKEVTPLLKGDTLLDAAFVHSVMRQESGYDRFAKSGVGALGLLQLMPATGRAMARKVGMGGFSASRLTDPEVNLRLGIAYLRDLSRVWKGRLPLVLANYNAGPAPTLRWSPAFDSLPVERAVEEITYWETRDYVKKCLGNVWTYRLLYPEAR